MMKLFKLKLILISIRKTICFLLVALFCVAAIPKPEKRIIGTWSYLSGSGGFTGKGPGWTREQQIEFVFKKNGKFFSRANKKIIASDRYTVQSNSKTQDQVVTLQFQKQITMAAFVRADTLFLTEQVADGFSYIFLKKK